MEVSIQMKSRGLGRIQTSPPMGLMVASAACRGDRIVPRIPLALNGSYIVPCVTPIVPPKVPAIVPPIVSPIVPPMVPPIVSIAPISCPLKSKQGIKFL